jgi:hypothetical protein
MDHIPSRGYKHVEVPFLIESREFNPHEFFEMLENAGPGFIGNGPGSAMGKSELNSFLQRLLFFALLAAFLGEPVDAARFREESYPQARLTTSHVLTSLLKKWEQKMDPHGAHYTQEAQRQISVELALSEARAFVSRWCSDTRMAKSRTAYPTTTNVDNASGALQIDPRLCLSFMILGETLDKALDRARRRKDQIGNGGSPQSLGPLGYLMDKSGNEPKSWGISKHLADRMEDNGWCKKDIRRIHLTMGDVSSVYFAHLFPRTPPTPASHKDCSFFDCVVNPPGSTDVLHTQDCIAESQHSQRHECPKLKPDETELLKIIRAGKLPLLNFSGGQYLTLSEYTLPEEGSLETGDKQSGFGAVSHVWTDGLGHSHGYGLPRCQLLRIRDSFRHLPRKNMSDSQQSIDMPFWIDSLCVPSIWELKRLAIPNISKVYVHAEAVIVLDPECMETHSQFPSLEAVVRINTGRWMQRLWTLQEGVLSKNLYFQFKDGALSSDQLRELSTSAKHGGLKHEFHHVYRAGWLLSPAAQELSRKRNQVANLWRLSQWRIASHATDEAIVLATLLGLDLTPLLAIKPSPENLGELMTTFLFHLDREIGIPSGMIFLPGKKLQKEGYRWAPETWLFDLAREFHYPLFAKEARTTFLTLRGLHVQYPGIEIHPPIEPLSSNSFCFWVPVSRNLNEWYRVDYINDGEESWLSKWEEGLKGFPKNKPALVLSQQNRVTHPEVALLVQPVATREETCLVEDREITQTVRWVKILCRVKIRLERDQESVKACISNFKRNPEFMMWGDKLPKDQRWCVDG